MARSTSISSRTGLIGSRRAVRTARGFTMLEMMLVVVIIGVLAGVAIFNMGGATTTAKIAATKGKLRQIMQAVTAYQSTNSANPPDLLTLTVPPTGVLVKGALKDAWREDFVYLPFSTSNDPNHFELYSKGPDKLPGTADDIDGWVVMEGE